MGKLLNLLFVIFAIQIALALFTVDEFDKGSIWNLLVHPENWSETGFIAFLIANKFLVGGLTTIVIGSIWFKSDFVVFAGITSVLFSFGTVFFNLWQYVNRQGILGGEIGGYSWVSILFVSPLILMWLIVLLDFWRGKD